jgi:hypothetical protein
VPADDEKRLAAEAAAELVADGMTVGLGTGSTVALLLPALAARNFDVRCVSTSVQTEQQARDLGIPVEPFETLERLDIAIDGADQIAPDGIRARRLSPRRPSASSSSPIRRRRWRRSRRRSRSSWRRSAGGRRWLA